MGLFYNPNIQPLQEYLLRREAAVQSAGDQDVEVIFMDKEYHPQVFLRHIVFREENRCFLCRQLRLERTRSMALKSGFDFFTTTLLFSKNQPFEQIILYGQSLSTDKCRFLEIDFRSGWKQGGDQSRAMGIYRQNYCGCIFSEFERFKGQLKTGGQQIKSARSDLKE